MSTFPRTRATAAWIARQAPGEHARSRAADLLAALRVLDGIPASGDPPPASHAMLRDLVLAARDLAGPSWLAASGDPHAAAFTALQAAPVPPPPARLDEIISGALRARFACLLRASTAARSPRLAAPVVPGRARPRSASGPGKQATMMTGPRTEAAVAGKDHGAPEPVLASPPPAVPERANPGIRIT